MKFLFFDISCYQITSSFNNDSRKFLWESRQLHWNVFKCRNFWSKSQLIECIWQNEYNAQHKIFGYQISIWHWCCFKSYITCSHNGNILFGCHFSGSAAKRLKKSQVWKNKSKIDASSSLTPNSATKTTKYKLFIFNFFDSSCSSQIQQNSDGSRRFYSF